MKLPATVNTELEVDARTLAARYISELFTRKPHSLKRYGGPNPTPEVVAKHAQMMREWNKERRAARKMLLDAMKPTKQEPKA